MQERLEQYKDKTLDILVVNEAIMNDENIWEISGHLMDIDLGVNDNDVTVNDFNYSFYGVIYEL